MVSVVKGREEPVAGRTCMSLMRRRWSSMSSGSDSLAVSRMDLRASAKGSLMSPIAELTRCATFVTISMIS